MRGDQYDTLNDVSHGEPLDEVLWMFERRVRQLEDYVEMDKELRKKNPALQDVYEKYQAVKKLVK